MLINSLPNLALSLYDFRDMTTIAICDVSQYAVIPPSGTYSLQITAPGQQLSNNVTFSPGQLNVYRCADLGITCSDSGCTPLPDGIYDVAYTVILVQKTPVYLEQKFIKIDQIKCKYQHAFLKVDLECGCHDAEYYKMMKQLKEIKVYIDGSVAEANMSNYVLSQKFYQKADYMLDRLACKFPHSNWKTCCGC